MLGPLFMCVLTKLIVSLKNITLSHKKIILSEKPGGKGEGGSLAHFMSQ